MHCPNAHIQETILALKQLFISIIMTALTAGLTIPAHAKPEQKDSPVIKKEKPYNNSKTLYPANSLAFFIGLGTGYGFSLALYPGIEYIVETVDLAERVPLSFGFSAKGCFSFVNNMGKNGPEGSLYSIGGFFTGHYSFRALATSSKILDSLDTHMGLGVAFTGASGGFIGGLGFASYLGISYYFSDNLAALVEGNYWAYQGGITVGIVYKL